MRLEPMTAIRVKSHVWKMKDKYYVEVDGNGLPQACDCKAGKYHGWRRCKHQTYLMGVLKLDGKDWYEWKIEPENQSEISAMSNDEIQEFADELYARG